MTLSGQFDIELPVAGGPDVAGPPSIALRLTKARQGLPVPDSFVLLINQLIGATLNGDSEVPGLDEFGSLFGSGEVSSGDLGLDGLLNGITLPGFEEARFAGAPGYLIVHTDLDGGLVLPTPEP
ncbi:MAG: hypothetical protein AAFV29_11575, partial [Myxococcota bacterium]